MADPQRVHISRLATGVPGLDEVLGGGLPEYSFNLIAGGPGAGKTTLTQQIMFANANPERPALHFTVLGEPALKLLRYQQQFNFFDPAKVDTSIRYLNLSNEVLSQDLGNVLERIVREVERAKPGIVVVDSFRTVVRAATAPGAGEMELQSFVQRLALHLTSWQATTFLVGEYMAEELHDSPVFTVADGLIWLTQAVERNSIVRKLQVMKVRGQAAMPGLHTFRVTDDGLQVFPRILKPIRSEHARPQQRLSTGNKDLDGMLGGGIPTGDSVLVAGPTGSGKTMMATQFISAGVAAGENGVVAVYEEHPRDYLQRAGDMGFDLAGMVREGKVSVTYLRPLDLSVDETLHSLRESVQRLGAKRVVIDSLSGFEIALAPTFREDFRESLYRMIGALTGIDVTVLMTVEVTTGYTELHVTPHAVSFLTDDIILSRYVEMEGQLRTVMTVVKMRRSAHSRDLRLYEVGRAGIVLGETLGDYRGILTGVPQLREPARRPRYPGLTEPETAALEALLELGESRTEDVAERSGLSQDAAARSIERLVALNYAVRNKDGIRYRAAVRALGG
jgi:circadian clock protein KaiC